MQAHFNIRKLPIQMKRKWELIKSNVKFVILPRRDEFIYIDELYFQVLNVVHKLNEKQDIFIVVENKKENNGKNI